MDGDIIITDLLLDAPAGSYLLEQTTLHRVLWRISEGEPADEALEPATLYPLLLHSVPEC